jgi:hypothetical protein
MLNGELKDVDVLDEFVGQAGASVASPKMLKSAFVAKIGLVIAGKWSDDHQKNSRIILCFPTCS